MATISITIPDASLQRVVDGMCAWHGYSATLPDGTPNSQTKGQFVKARIAAFVKESVKNAETAAATVGVGSSVDGIGIS